MSVESVLYKAKEILKLNDEEYNGVLLAIEEMKKRSEANHNS